MIGSVVGMLVGSTVGVGSPLGAAQKAMIRAITASRATSIKFFLFINRFFLS